MGKVLQQALTELTKLPEPEQDAVGAWLLAELESEVELQQIDSGEVKTIP